MIQDLEIAQQLLEKNQATLVVVFQNDYKIFYDRGVKPLLLLLNNNCDYRNYCAADRVIGKAAAFLYVKLGLKEIYSELVSEEALKVFAKYKVNITYKEKTPLILNRKKDGYCPMETAVLQINNPEDAYLAIKQKLQELEKMK